MRPGRAVLALVLGLALPAFADAPSASLRPLPRPGAGPLLPIGPGDRVVAPSDPLVVTIRSSALAPAASERPLPRPGGASVAADDPEPEASEAANRPPSGLLALLTGQPRVSTPQEPAVRVSLRVSLCEVTASWLQSMQYRVASSVPTSSTSRLPLQLHVLRTLRTGKKTRSGLSAGHENG